jgi:Carboxypeptidase regulatory-like domain
MKIIILSLLFLAVPKLMLSQASTPRAPVAAKKAPTKRAKAPETGELTGFVFAITKAGDLKPARLAHIVLLYEYKSGLSRTEEFPKSAGVVYLQSWFKTFGDAESKIAKSQLLENNRLSKDEICALRLQENIAALQIAVQWAMDENKSEQIQTTDADEEGHFKLTKLPPGEYTLTASCQAGANMAFWQQEDNVVITAGQTTSVKLSSPKWSCLAQ